MHTKTFAPLKVGQLVPISGFMWRVVECNNSEVRLQVYQVTKAGKEKGYVITEKKDNPLGLKESDIVGSQ